MSARAEPSRRRAGWRARGRARSCRACGCSTARSRSARAGSLTGDSPPDVERAPARTLQPLPRRARVGIRREPVPAAYRVFFRHIGLDPDVERTPIEAAVLERMLRGGFLTGGLLEDVAADRAARHRRARVGARRRARRRPARDPRERRGRARSGASSDAPLLPAGTARRRRRVGGARRAVRRARGRATRRARARERLTLFAVQVAGVPALYAEEALWAVPPRWRSAREPALARGRPLVESALRQARQERD